jgi:hypothetical protein
MRTSQNCQLRVEDLEARATPAATWVVISPGTHAVAVEQTVPNAAVPGLTNAALHANAVQTATCWLVRIDSGPVG